MLGHLVRMQSRHTQRVQLLTKHLDRCQRQLATVAVSSASATHPAFEIVKTDVVEEYSADCILYRHKVTGAEVLSVSKDDDNKVFGIAFRTPPSDSKGIPHILEHSVLCGSRKYPTKDPFVTLLQGSLQTFLNAMTYPDRTVYPVASQNLQDFYNLTNVYLDAVFFPRAIDDPRVMAQEGWHYELDEGADPSDMVFKGVVYNEMKGVYSSPDALLGRAIQTSLFPDVTYGVDSGGDPLEIRKLSFDEFRNFHDLYYHPANSRIFFYGDDPVEERLTLLDEYLGQFSALPDAKARSVVGWQPRLLAPSHQVAYYPASAEEGGEEEVAGKTGKLYSVVNWVVNDAPLCEEDKLAFEIFDHLLMGTSAARLNKTLTDSGLGASVTGGGLDTTLQQATFSVGLKGVHTQEDCAQVEALVMDIFADVAVHGFEADAVRASLNTIEFRLREFNTGSFPRGLSFMLGSLTSWLYEDDPIDSLRFEKPLAALKARLERGEPVFQELAVRYFSDARNPHRVTVTMHPSQTLESEWQETESAELRAAVAAMSADDIAAVARSTAELRAMQEGEDSEEAKATIPRLSLGDLTKTVKEVPCNVTRAFDGVGVGAGAGAGAEVALISHPLSTAGIAYVDVGLNLGVLPLEDLELLPLFTRMLTETGTGSMDRVALSRAIGAKTGGLSASSMVLPTMRHGADAGLGDGDFSGGERGHRVCDPEAVTVHLVLGGKATEAGTPDLLQLMQEVLTDANLHDRQRAIEMLREAVSRAQASVISGGHAYANTRISSQHSLVGYIAELTGGLTFLESTKRLLAQAESDSDAQGEGWPALHERLRSIRSRIVGQLAAGGATSASTSAPPAFMNVTTDALVLDRLSAPGGPLLGFLSTLRTASAGIAGGAGGAGATTAGAPGTAAWAQQWRAALHSMDKGPLAQGIAVPTQVNYVGRGGCVFGPGEVAPGSAAVAARMLRTGYIWDQVRVLGGAYGGFAQFGRSSGTMSFLSYRDPNLAQTLDVYSQAAAALRETVAAMTDTDLEQAVIGMVGDMDSPSSPNQEGSMALQRYLMHEGPDARQRYRDQVLGTTREDLLAFAERLEAMSASGLQHTVIVGSQTALEGAKENGIHLNVQTVS